MQRALGDITSILFDFGGTLDGPGLPWIERFASAYAGAGLDLPFEQLRDAVGYGTRCAYGTPDLAAFDLRATVTFHVTNQFKRLRIEDPAAAAVIVDDFVTGTVSALAESRAVLRRLQRRFRLGVVSNFYGNVARLLTEANIAPLLTVMIDSTVVGVAKPDPRIFKLAVSGLESSPIETLYVGDSLEQDIVPARAVGLRTALIATAPPEHQACAADIAVTSLTELEQVLLQ